MLSIIEQLKQGQLWDFPGGVHPPEHKTLSNHSKITPAALPAELVLPLKQHIGAIGDVIVNVGDQVLKGQPLTHADVAMSVPIHAPTSGTVTAIESRTIAHPSGLSDMCIVIQPDGNDTWIERTAFPNYQDTDTTDLINHIRRQGISGMGGAGFPTGRKLQSGLGKTELLIINAAECEPYITADDRLMQDYASEVIEGIRILQHILSPKMAVIGIEDNKPEAIEALHRCIQDSDKIMIRAIPTKYPSGGEKQLIKILTGREVPTKGIPADIGVMMQNVGTTHAIKRAVIDGEPLIERVVTLTGKTFKQPGNTWALLGTPVDFLLERFGYKAEKKSPRVIMGGPMMGFTLPHSSVPITKTANCILAPTRKEITPHNHEMACIRCSACAEACPVSLLPQQLQWYAKDQDYDKCEEYNLFDCIECGSCAYVCPSEIPLVQYYRQAKSEIRARKQDEANAERARLRFEAKQARLERDKAERENRFKKAADDRRKEMTNAGGDDAVAAAIARVKAKQAQAAAPKASDEKKPAVAAAIARAKAKQAAAQQAGSDTPDNSEMAKLREERKRQARERKAALAAEQTSSAETPASTGDTKKDAVAAAIARAKARKAAQQAEQPAESAPEDQTTEPAKEADPKKAAVAAAIARAKARKAAQQAEQPAESTSEAQTAEPAKEADPKKAAVAAAVARAKARKAAQQAAQQAESEPEAAVETKAAPVTEPDEAVDPKKAAVAAAVARAKARKAAQQAAQQAESEPEAAVETEASPVKEPAEEIDPKKAAVAAAVARAKARKAAQQAAQQAEPEPEAAVETEAAPVTESDEAVDPKKAAVAAAVARAKARKAAQQAAQQAESEPEAAVETKAAPVKEPAEEIDPKKAAVAAAIARAKARKAAQQAAQQAEKEQTAQQNNEEN
ncbi:electron transport complex subunit RsxC [Photobacterium jeanii]|uniref:Ion-translocating oxidoreductase complex subunit C n=1 Tax=Photobacterium jeanii TaxID=858640 RepID=A0A178K9M3_9GAMM|nr:electron transport complex subunit RsxC [Photobacterium jeanii]OAN13645.1 electron transport complex subunit RsxC [Photobacterium jeanii]PST88764.1 electron transport complex subunit RsxC [Photobacterium jeanii]